MKIITVPFIKGTPARVNRNTGDIYISAWHFKQINPVYQKFILYHEMAHFLFKTKSENMADEFAMMKMIKEGYSLKDIVKSITHVLSQTRAHHGRKLNILNHIRIYDYLYNNNQKALNPVYYENI